MRRFLGPHLVKWRNLVCFPLIAILPVSLLADDTGAAILRSNPGVLLNKNPAPVSSALFPDDLVETPQKSVARIEATGSTADISPDTIVQFEGDELVLEHGSLSVSTTRQLRVRVGCLTVTPVNADWTQYEVSDIDGKVEVSAVKDDVYIDARSSNPQNARRSHLSERTLVREGERKSRDEMCGAAAPVSSGSPIAAKGAILNSPYVKWSAIGVIGVLTCYALCQSDDALSPSHP